jgi:hypothetical protein
MITVRDIREKLAGQRFVQRNKDGVDVEVRFPTDLKSGGWPRKGLEGYAIPVTISHPVHGDRPSILKTFVHEVPTRAQRLDHLVSYGLAADHDWLFTGVPFASVRRNVNGLAIDGHISKHACFDINGEDFSRLKNLDEFDHFTPEQRIWLAQQLCCGVVGLERKGIVHGDLSHGNLIVGYNDDRSRIQAVIIDYDGFYATGAPSLPRRHAGQPIRPLGTPGYQHPSLMKRITGDKTGADDGIRVESDRFALGVLCCELMCWNSQTGKELSRDELLSPDDLAGGLRVAPVQLHAVWPEGAQLLETALATRHADDLPAPDEWLRALGMQVGGPAPTPFANGAPANLKISRQSGRGPLRHVRSVNMGTNANGAGDLGSVDQRLASVGYEYSRENGVVSLALIFKWNDPVKATRDGLKLGVDGKEAGRPLKIEVGRSDVIRSNGWRFDFD